MSFNATVSFAFEYTQVEQFEGFFFFFFYVYNPNLIGEIPERIGDMVYLEKLVMSQNGL